jgi:putative transcriptional regulator
MTTKTRTRSVPRARKPAGRTAVPKSGDYHKIGAEMAEDFGKLVEAARSGRPVGDVFTVRQVRRDMEPGKHTARSVCEIRRSLNVSQGVFARFLGVTPGTVQAWEQGRRKPLGTARRFLDEIGRDPDHWRGRLVELSGAR